MMPDSFSSVTVYFWEKIIIKIKNNNNNTHPNDSDSSRLMTSKF